MAAALVNQIGVIHAGYLVRFLLGALIGPNQARTQRRACPIHGDDAHHLPAKTDGGNRLGLYARLRQKLLGRQANGVPPIRWILFGPIRVGIVGWITRKGAAQQCPIRIKQIGFVPRRAQVMGENQALVRHRLPHWLISSIVEDL